MKDTTGVRIPRGLKLGFSQLDWQRDQINERANWWRLGRAAEAGWVGRWIGPNLDFGWEVYDQGSGVLAVRSTGSDGTPMHFGRVRPNTARPCVGLDRDGNVLEITPADELLDNTDTPITVPNDGVWYTLVATFRVRVREPGTLSLTAGSVTVTGTGTQFTRYRDSSPTYGTPDRIRIDVSDTISGNEGTYVIDTIANDTSLTLTSPPPATENPVEFRVTGEFATGTPADPDIHWNAIVAWSLVARTTTRPTTGLIAYDVRRSGGALTVLDRRRANVYREIDGDVRATAVVPANLWWSNLDVGGGSGDSSAVYAGSSRITLASAQAAQQELIGMSMARCAVGSELAGLATDHPTGMMIAMCWRANTSVAIAIRHYSPADASNVAASVAEGGMPGRWDDPNNGSAVNVINAATGTLDVALLALPPAIGTTHICFYVLSTGVLARKTSTDDGATWSTEATIWSPSGGVTISKVSAVLTRLNVIVVAAAISGGNRIRYIYSTDYGATWDTNTNAGYSSSTAGEAVADLSIVEDVDGNLWTVAAVGSSAAALRVYRGQAEGNPVPNTAEQSAGWKTGLDRQSGTPGSATVEAIAFRDGSLGVFFDNGADELMFAQIAGRYTLHLQTLVSSPMSTEWTGYQICAAVGSDGIVHAAWSNAYFATTYYLDVRTVKYLPVEIGAPLAF